jgi:hypothetical protein
MQTFGMLSRVDLVRTDVSEEHIASIIILEEGILHSHRQEYLKSYKCNNICSS